MYRAEGGHAYQRSSMSYLVDTDWIIDGLRGRPLALAVLEERRDEGLGVSIVTLGEVYEGAHN